MKKALDFNATPAAFPAQPATAALRTRHSTLYCCCTTFQLPLRTVVNYLTPPPLTSPVGFPFGPSSDINLPTTRTLFVNVQRGPEPRVRITTHIPRISACVLTTHPDLQPVGQFAALPHTAATCPLVLVVLLLMYGRWPSMRFGATPEHYPGLLTPDTCRQRDSVRDRTSHSPAVLLPDIYCLRTLPRFLVKSVRLPASYLTVPGYYRLDGCPLPTTARRTATLPVPLTVCRTVERFTPFRTPATRIP